MLDLPFFPIFPEYNTMITPIEYYFYLTFMNLLFITIIFAVFFFFYRRFIKRITAMQKDSLEWHSQLVTMTDTLQSTKAALTESLSKNNKSKTK
jgi:hypothetical protein